MTTPYQVLGLLQSALEADPEAMHMLVEQRVLCSQAMVEHPTIVVSGTDTEPTVGILGIINGILGPDGVTIEAVYDRKRRLVDFRMRHP